MRNKLSKILVSGATFLGLSSSVFAAVETNPITWLTDLTNLAPGTLTLQGIIMGVINFLIGAAALVCVVMLVWAGYSYMTAGGDEGKVTKATKTLTNAIIGLVISLIALVLVNFIKGTIIKMP